MWVNCNSSVSRTQANLGATRPRVGSKYLQYSAAAGYKPAPQLVTFVSYPSSVMLSLSTCSCINIAALRLNFSLLSVVR